MSTTVSNAGFLTALYVPLVPIAGALLLRERSHWSVWPASLGCVAGTHLPRRRQPGRTHGGRLVGDRERAVFLGRPRDAGGARGGAQGTSVTVAMLQFLVVGGSAWR